MINKVLLVGRLGQDPELKEGQTGTKFAKLNIATNRSWQNNSGEWQDETEWHNVTVFGRMVDNVAQRYAKGSLVYIEGRIQSRKVDEKTYYGVIANHIRLLAPGKNQQQDSINGSQPSTEMPPVQQDEIPF